MRKFQGVVGGWIVVAALPLGACTYNQLSPGAESVVATTSRPAGNCKSLGTLTGKGGGATGAWVSNEDLMSYAINDLRNQAKELGATHVVTASPSLGGSDGTTTSAMVMGEALKCDGSADAPATALHVEPAAKKGGCEYDAQCKGDRVCVDHACVNPAADPAAAPRATTPAPPEAPSAAK